MNISTALAANVIIPLLSLSGLLGGLLLSYLAREELAAGKRYFVISYRVLFILLSLVVAYFISSSSFSSYSSSLSFSIAIIFFLIAIILLILDLKSAFSTSVFTGSESVISPRLEKAGSEIRPSEASMPLVCSPAVSNFFDKSYRALFLFQYLFFLTGYFVAEKQIIIAVILFLYGLPVGTLLQMKN